MTRKSAASGTNVNKRRPRVSAAVPMRLLFEDFRIFTKSDVVEKDSEIVVK